MVKNTNFQCLIFCKMYFCTNRNVKLPNRTEWCRDINLSSYLLIFPRSVSQNRFCHFPKPQRPFYYQPIYKKMSEIKLCSVCVYLSLLCTEYGSPGANPLSLDFSLPHSKISDGIPSHGKIFITALIDLIVSQHLKSSLTLEQSSPLKGGPHCTGIHPYSRL